MESQWRKIFRDRFVLAVAGALIGFAGVVMGVFLNALKEWLFNKSKDRKDAQYLAIRVVVLLDNFVNACLDVAHDNGSCHGALSETDYATAQVSCPTFHPETILMEWKSLPVVVNKDVTSFHTAFSLDFLPQPAQD